MRKVSLEIQAPNSCIQPQTRSPSYSYSQSKCSQTSLPRFLKVLKAQFARIRAGHKKVLNARTSHLAPASDAEIGEHGEQPRFSATRAFRYSLRLNSMLVLQPTVKHAGAIPPFQYASYRGLANHGCLSRWWGINRCRSSLALQSLDATEIVTRIHVSNNQLSGSGSKPVNKFCSIVMDRPN